MSRFSTDPADTHHGAHRVIPFVLALALCPTGADLAPSFPETVELRFRTQRQFALELPNETWSKLSSALPSPLAGHDGYGVLLDGGNLQIDTDADGKPDVTVEGKEGLVNLRNPDGQTVGAVRLKRGRDGWVWSNSGSMVGKLGEIKIQLIDQNNNGRYNDVGEDAMIVGRGRDACFLSEVVCVAGQLLSVEVAPDGSSIAVESFDGPAGTLDLVSDCETDAKLAWAVVKSTDGKYSFDLSKAKGGQALPAGDYILERGRVALGKSHATIKRGRSKTMSVAAHETVSLEWGGPVKAEFGYVKSGSQIEFSPTDIDYYGTFGELYQDFLPLGKSPEFSVKDRLTGEELVNAKFPGNC